MKLKKFISNVVAFFLAPIFFPAICFADLSPEQIKIVDTIAQQNLSYFSELPNNISLKYTFVLNDPTFILKHDTKISSDRICDYSQSESRNKGLRIFAFDGTNYQEQNDDYLLISKSRTRFETTFNSIWASCPITLMFNFTSPSQRISGGCSALAQWNSWSNLAERIVSINTTKIEGRDFVQMEVKVDKGIMRMTFDPNMNYYPIKLENINSSGQKQGESVVKKFKKVSFNGKNIIVPSLIIGRTPKSEYNMCILDDESLSFDEITNVDFFKIPLSGAVHVTDLDIKVDLK